MSQEDMTDVRHFTRRQVAGAAVVVTVFALVVHGYSTYARLSVPVPTGEYAVGRERLFLMDEERLEEHTANPSDRRELVVHVWYPARSGTGQKGSYLPDLDIIADGLKASGELSGWQVAGLKFVRDNVLKDAPLSPSHASFPVVLFSPGNATNAVFYAALAEDLASHGYVVFGIEHPYQVTAVALSSGEVAVYEPQEAVPLDRRAEVVASLIDERVQDIRFVFESLSDLPPDSAVAGRLDLDRVGTMGHSNGGIAAMQACAADPRFLACLNIDGQLLGGPFAAELDPALPTQHFMYLTKETGLHARFEHQFEEAGKGAFRVVIPEADHTDWTDGALFSPQLNPLSAGAAPIVETTRGFNLAFFDYALRGAPVTVFAEVTAETGVFVNVYPLGGKPALPN
jgi:dienelactone hydrolase